MGRKNKKVNGIVNKDDRVWVRWHETELETIPEIKKVPIYGARGRMRVKTAL